QAEVLLNRAKVANKWGHALPRTKTPDAFAARSRLFESALADLAEVRRLWPDLGAEWRQHVEIQKARAEMGLGDVASAQDFYHESVPRFRSAQQGLSRALEFGPRMDGEVKDLIGEVRRRLEIDTRKLRSGDKVSARAR